MGKQEQDVLDNYVKTNKHLLNLSNGLHDALRGIFDFTKGKPIGSDLYNIHMAAYEGLETYRKVYKDE